MASPEATKLLCPAPEAFPGARPLASQTDLCPGLKVLQQLEAGTPARPEGPLGQRAFAFLTKERRM